MCHPVIREILRLRTCSSREYQDFRRRWDALFQECGLHDLARAAGEYAHRFGEGVIEEAQLNRSIEELMLVFGLSLLEAVGSECPYASTAEPESA